MALERSVMMGDGVVRRFHKIQSIQHVLDQVTLIDVVSYQYGENDGTIGCHTNFSHDFDDDLTFAEAYEWIAQQDIFQEYVNDSEAELIAMNARLIEANETITQQNETIQEKETDILSLNEEITSVSGNLNTVLNVLTDEQALDVPQCFPLWNIDVSYALGVRVLYNNALYKCVQAHTSQLGWEPSDVPALWTRVALPNTIDEWRQPTGAQDVYMTGDKVTYNGDIWISIVDNNSWAPGVYGWEMESN
jgi:hypothetical protein